MSVTNGPGDTGGEFGPWNPGLSSTIPQRLLPLSTMFRPENVETGFRQAHELADFSGLAPKDTIAFRAERLIVHELLIRVTADLSVPDGPEYEELGINMRGMTARIYEEHVRPRLGSLKSEHESLVRRAREFITAELQRLDARDASQEPASTAKGGLLERWLGREKKPTQPTPSSNQNAALEAATARWAGMQDPFEAACANALSTVTSAVVRTHGRLPFDKTMIVELATNLFVNEYGSAQLGSALEPIIAIAADTEGYRFLPAQTKPFVMNVKGASAAGKSTIRPHQRELAKKLGVPWEDFALVSPDYWRKHLLDYGSLGADYKYGAMLTGHELEIIDRKLDRYMAEKADRGTMPHLLIDRFRFDSFRTGDNQDRGSNLLTRFGHTVFMFFMVTPPPLTVERAWKRGLTTGRYKAVDDLLHHNIEAYTGMPALFLSWALSDKKVHYEFLDNDVPKGERPRTIASGWNRRMNVYDVEGLLNIERFKKVDVRASGPGEVYQEGADNPAQNLGFLRQCVERLDQVRFVDPKSRKRYGLICKDGGAWLDRSLSSCPDEISDLLEE
ncbi:ATP-binding protein, partial [Aurantimonas marianensis]